LRFGFPESPMYLAKKGNLKEAAKILRKVASSNKTPLPEFSLVLESTVLETRTLRDQCVTLYARLLSPKMKRTMILLSIIWFTINVGFSSFNMFLPVLLTRNGIVIEHAYQDVFIYAAVGIPGSLLGAYLVETKFGRKWTMAIWTAMSGLFMLTFGFSRSHVLFITFSSFVSFSSQIMYAAVYTYTPEVFPTTERSSAVGFVSSLAKIAGLIAPFMTGALIDVFWNLPLFVDCGLMLLGSLAMIFLPMETRGKPLD